MTSASARDSFLNRFIMHLLSCVPLDGTRDKAT
jgi:hypothetical protein